MIVSSPIPRAKQPKWHESSPLQTPRESDSTGRQWLRARTSGFNSEGVYRELNTIKQLLGKYRRRVVGGGGSTSGTGMQWKGEYNGGSYSAQNVVTFTPDGAPAAGNYVALKNVPVGVSPDTGSPFWQVFSYPAPGQWA